MEEHDIIQIPYTEAELAHMTVQIETAKVSYATYQQKIDKLKAEIKDLKGIANSLLSLAGDTEENKTRGTKFVKVKKGTKTPLDTSNLAA